MPNVIIALKVRRETVKDINAGDQHSLAINDQNQNYAWGANGNGQIATNSITRRSTPNSISGAKKTFCSINAFGNFSVAIDRNSRLWSWGLNSNGQLGDNTTANKSTPVRVCHTDTRVFCQIAAGNNHVLAVTTTGVGWSWGANANGQLGQNSTTATNTPLQISGAAKTFCKIAAGISFSLAINNAGTGYSWGLNTSGQLGINATTSRLTPVSILGGLVFCKISAGDAFAMALTSAGRGYAWGLNSNGELGRNDVANRSSPVSICFPAASSYCHIAAGKTHSLAIDATGRLWGWGNNFYGGVGVNTIVDVSSPTLAVGGGTAVFCQIDAGDEFSIAIDDNGKVWAWGKNNVGQLGIGQTEVTPLKIIDTTRSYTKISAGEKHTVGIITTGKAYAWGFNSNTTWNLGFGFAGTRSSPQSVRINANSFCEVAAGYSHNVAVSTNGILYTWGNNGFGQLGNVATTNQCTPIAIATTLSFNKVAAGREHSAGVTTTGTLYAWGRNNNGQLGTGSIANFSSPRSIACNAGAVCSVAAGEYFTAMLTSGGGLFLTGRANFGQLGQGGTIDKSTFGDNGMATTDLISQMSLGKEHMVVITQAGKLYAWGRNDLGQVGDNTVVDRCVPTSLPKAGTYCKVAAGFYHTLAINNLGQAFAWGQNTYGQLGDNTIANKSTPIRVCGTQTFCEISAGDSFSVAVDNLGQTWAWGLNWTGQLALNYVNVTPIKICVI